MEKFYSKNKINNFWKILLIFLATIPNLNFSQTLSATNVYGGTVPCQTCTPTNWTSLGGTPDISTASQAATTGTSGGGASWRTAINGGGEVFNLPLPPNGHTFWLSLRDLGGGGTEESVSTVLGGLVVGREYEIVLYSLTAATGTGDSSFYYAGRYNLTYLYQINGLSPQEVTIGTPNSWGVNKVRFTATATTATLILRPGSNSTATANTAAQSVFYETVQISATVNAVNSVPIAVNDNVSVVGRNPVSINVLTNDSDPGGSLNLSSVDLDPSTPGIQNTFNDSQGSWVVNSVGNVTFTPASYFSGTAVLPYTVQDNYTVPGSTPVTSAPATSSPAYISIFVSVDSDGDGITDDVDLDDDNDGILDAVESPNCFYTLAEASQIVSVTSPLNGAAGDPQAGANITTLFNGSTADANPFNFAANQPLQTGTPIFTVQYQAPIALTNLTVTQLANGMGVSPAFGRLYGSIDGVTYTLLTTGTNAISISGTSASFASTSTTPYLYYQIRYTGTSVTNTTSGTAGIANIQEITSTVSATVTYIPSANQKRQACTADTDGDGIPNHLDLDSDNDGCPDGLEGASTSITISNLVNSSMPGGNSGATSGSFNQPVIRNLGNTVNTTPGSASYGVPTIAGAGQGVGESQNSTRNDCIDADGDNVPDYMDLDDDNDGILDAIESPSCFYTIVEANQIVSVVSPLNGAAGDPQAGTNITTLFNGSIADANPFNFVGGQVLVTGAPIFTIRYPTPVALSNVTITQVANGISSAGFGRLYGSNDGVNYTLLTTDTNAISLSTASVSFANTSTSTFIFYQIRYTGTTATNTTSGTTGTANIQEIASTLSMAVVYNPSANPKPGPCGADTDGDGIPNHLDLDSDNDGCPDAQEGSGNFTAAQLTTASGTLATQNPNRNFGIAVNQSTGIPTVAGAGQGFGFSQDARISVCLDSDNDGIIDLYDLDDDNDGITDAAECGGGAVFNYTGFGVRTVGAAPNQQTDLYGFAGTDSAPVLLSTAVLGTAVTANHLATDAARNRLLFTVNGTQGAISAYNFGTQTISTVSSATFLSTLGTTSGGGAMYNGDYYIYDDNGDTTNQGIYRITFDAAGNANSLARIAEPIVGADLGDLAINAIGMAYVIAGSQLYKLDLTAIYSGAPAPSSSWVLVGSVASSASSQLFFRGNGELIGSNNGSLVKINPNTAANEGTELNLTGFAWGDLSEAPTVGFICGTDTDGDGIPNHLDLDSDNDGCPDAIEGDGPFLNANLVTATGPISTQNPNRNLGNTIGSNVATIGIPTVAGLGQGIGNSQNSSANDCRDSDGDGIPDPEDLDDDNDGILDAVESPNCYYTATEANTIARVISPFNGTAPDPQAGNNIPTLFNGSTTDANPFNFATLQTVTPGTAIFNITYPMSIVLSSLNVNKVATGIANTGFGRLFGSNNGVDYTAISPTGISFNTTNLTFNNPTTNAYRYYRIVYVGTVAGGNTTSLTLGDGAVNEITSVISATYIPSANPKPGICSNDTDGDGVPNHLDLDSDGDGCPDAIEGGAIFTTANLVTATGTISTQTPNQNLGNTVGNTATTLGVPTIAGTGQTVGNSQSFSKNDCLDSDGDGIPDWEDVDDDNDGILDTAECSNTFSDLLTAFSGGRLLGIMPSDFGLALGVRNQNITRDISAKFGYPANSGAVVISITNASVHPTQDAWWTKQGESQSVWKVSGTMSAFVLMTQNPEYYGSDSKTIHIYDGETVITITGTGIPGQDNQTPSAQWSTNVTATAKTLTNLQPEDSNQANIKIGQWRFANMNFGPKTFGFSTTTRFADPTYAVNMYLECDSDMDGIPDRLDLDSDADGCSDALEGGAVIETTQLQTSGGTLSGGSTNVNQNICTTCVSTGGANIGLPQFVTPVPSGYSNATGQSIGDSKNGAVAACFCTQLPASGTGEITKVGISVQQRQDGWPENIPNGHIVLESKEKGLVITRVAHVSFVPQATDSIATPFAGMLVYDIQDACVKLFNGINWKCLQRSCNTASN